MLELTGRVIAINGIVRFAWQDLGATSSWRKDVHRSSLNPREIHRLAAAFQCRVLSICIRACITLYDRAGSLSSMSWPRMGGTICQERPYLSFRQPHWLFSPLRGAHAPSRADFGASPNWDFRGKGSVQTYLRGTSSRWRRRHRQHARARPLPRRLSRLK
ncbi:MAG: hypothetical protein QOH39_1933 [Verrucomicrobiota bacterium]